MSTLAVKYRPNTFEEMTEQFSIVSILKHSIENKTFKNVYLFVGSSGCGKTTTARIFANMINDNKSIPIEIDAASNGSVDNVRQIIEDCKFPPIESKYRIYIIDEAHGISTTGWQSFLKILEEPPKATIFIFCTTEVHKIPDTILSRVQRFDFQKLSNKAIKDRLEYIINNENVEKSKKDKIIYDDKSLDYVVKISNGGMRMAISNLEKCISFNKIINLENVVSCLSVVDYDILLNMLDYIFTCNRKKFLIAIEKIHKDGLDIKRFIDNLLYCCIDIAKFDVIRNFDFCNLPESYKSFFDKKKDDYFLFIADFMRFLLELRNNIKYENNPLYIIQALILNHMESLNE